jgi:two-component system response regulator VicR
LNILIVEDDPSLSEVLAIVCRREGHEPVVAYDGEDALGKLDAQPFALLIVDARMPKLDGAGFIRTVRQRHDHGTLPIFGMTAGTEIEDQRALKDAGADRIIKKPFQVPTLRQAIRDALGT